jgi:hypothetical protein
MVSPALWKPQTVSKQVLEAKLPGASEPETPQTQRRDPVPGGGRGAAAGDVQLGLAGRRGRVRVETPRLAPTQAAGQRPRPRAPVPGGPLPRNSPARTAGGPSQGPRAGAVGTRATVPVAEAVPERWQ